MNHQKRLRYHRRLILPLSFGVLACLSPDLSYSQDQEQKISDADAEAKLLELSEACRKQQRTDVVCNFLVTIKQVGDDALEAIKAYVDLSENQYKALTVINVLATGRFRLKYKSGLTKTGMDTIDIQKDQFTYTFEDTF